MRGHHKVDEICFEPGGAPTQISTPAAAFTMLESLHEVTTLATHSLCPKAEETQVTAAS